MTARDALPDALAALLRPELAELAAYAPHPGRFDVRLDANECPPLLSAEARAAIAAALVPEDLGRYPDARATALRATIAARSGCDPGEVMVGVGSDEIIATLLTALAAPGDRGDAAIVTPSPTFVMYRQSARARGVRVVEVPLVPRTSGWDLDVDAMARAIEQARPSLVFIASPNNPTGALMAEDRVEAVIAAAPGALVVIDEAYVDFAPRAQLHLRQRFENVAVIRTLSKVGLASLRVGWLLAPAALIAELDKVRLPYNVPVPSQRAATLALGELGGEITRVAAEVVAERERLAAGLAALGCDVAPSHANFLWIEPPRSAASIREALAVRGVLVRSFPAAQRLRVTVGLPADNDRFLTEMAACL